MYRLTAKDIAHACGAAILFGDELTAATNVVIDSREVAQDSLFIAFSGEHVDGHDYLVAAAKLGASVLLVTQESEALALRAEIESAGAAVLLAADAQGALQKLAVYQRTLLEKAGATVIGITGSTGKTTAKEFCAAALEAQFSTIATHGNQNNELGVPLTILRATEETEVLVVEMGMRAKGEIADSVTIAFPWIGLIVSTGLSHIEVLGSADAIAEAKGELIAGLKPGGIAIANLADEYVDYYASLAKGEFITVGEDAGTVSVSDITVDDSACASATVSGWFGQVDVKLPVPGRFQIFNAAYAIAICACLGGNIEKAAAALSQVTVTGMRYQTTYDEATGLTIINDAYNANPTSMAASLNTFAAQHVAGRRIVVLGDMKELGEESIRAHERLGTLLGDLHFDVVFTYGPLAEHIAKQATSAGVVHVAHYEVGKLDKLSQDILALAQSGDAVLLKASRAMELERVAERIGEGSVR